MSYPTPAEFYDHYMSIAKFTQQIEQSSGDTRIRYDLHTNGRAFYVMWRDDEVYAVLDCDPMSTAQLRRFFKRML